ncbi:hypothetical protein KS4_14650 [Poriferisphaera corsica]|uniref:Uncharacterized protein n=1 Tax=Poriferisphaera corsica TaxID=2528020 RepID=A0A517YT60_9BACT|nr:hypothetical protein KS4_14650 [Poriferisphaera corsica]
MKVHTGLCALFLRANGQCLRQYCGCGTDFMLVARDLRLLNDWAMHKRLAVNA